MIKQTLAALKSLGWLKLLMLVVAVIGVGVATFFYLRQTNSTPADTPTPKSAPQSSSAPSQTPSSPPKSEQKPTPTPQTPQAQVPKPAAPSAPSTPSTPATPSPTTPPSASACTNPTWSTSVNLGSWNTNGYLVNNNIWNAAQAGPQTIYACAWNNWYIISDQPGDGTDDSVKTYPDTQKHVNIPLSSLPTINSSWNVATPSAGGAVTPNSKQWNAAYDLWLDNFDTEVMVWTNWTANWQYWYGVYNGVDVTIDGVLYHAYYDGDDGMWFIRDSVTNNGSVNLTAILQWALSQGWLQSNQVLHEIEYGFEVLYTGEPTRFDLINYTLSTN